MLNVPNPLRRRVSRTVAARAGERVERVFAGAGRSGSDVDSLARLSSAVVIGHIGRVTSTGAGGIDRGSGAWRTAAGEGASTGRSLAASDGELTG
jgi:hypothetical protein